ncbi:uncharacterized protein BDW70DRAFT_172115 [Aspergillus foveolatus]|uniref:uncharacterized protein n=1 Tax=Aspergillus foveolatus TaxID=210207 RepID=UPI003CCCC840
MVRFSLFGTPLSSILVLALATCAVAVVDKWTPGSFNWSALNTGPRESWKGLNHNGTEAHIKKLSVLSNVDVRTTEDGVTVLVVPWAIGLAWHTFNLALTGIGLASTIKTCPQNESQPDNLLFCVTGLVSTIVGVGGESGLELIDLRKFSRDLNSLPAADMTSQKAYSHFVHQALRSLSTDEVEFVGYAPDSHKLARRDSSVHPFAPMFRFSHHKYGPMELISRDMGETGVHFTISYADRKKQVECFVGTEWNEGNVLSVQMYDDANHAMFGYASIGMFPDDSVDSGLQDFEPQGMPLTGGQDY